MNQEDMNSKEIAVLNEQNKNIIKIVDSILIKVDRIEKTLADMALSLSGVKADIVAANTKNIEQDIQIEKHTKEIENHDSEFDKLWAFVNKWRGVSIALSIALAVIGTIISILSFFKQ